jgi:ATP-dependent DNA helicase RecG
MVSSNDGFELAEIDLELRGEGTLLGARQRGRSDLKLASLRRDTDILEHAKLAAHEMVRDDVAMEPDGDLVDELSLFVDDDEADYLFKS